MTYSTYSSSKPDVYDDNNEIKDIKSKIYDKNSFISAKEIGTDFTYKHELVLKNAILLPLVHLLGWWGLKILLTGGIGWKSCIWNLILTFICSQGITVGAHRYITHRCFKAKPLLKAILLFAHLMAGENSIYVWCRDHRLHHRYSDTDGDPHNAKRGFFFSHVGWLIYRKHPYVKELGKRIDMSDVEADWMAMFQTKYQYPLFFVFGFLMPIWVPVYFFGENWLNSFLVCFMLRYIFQLNSTWLVNSAAHLYGTRPYDKKLQPVDSWFVSLLCVGEGWHNYHHTFPWDYKAAELWEHINISARTIRFFEAIGLAYDLKTVTPEQIKNRILRTGDGTHYLYGTEDARARVTALGPLHPLNPSYNVTYPPPSAQLGQEGLPLFHENDVFCMESTTDIKSDRNSVKG